MFWKTSSTKFPKFGFEGQENQRPDKLVMAHFMLGNTYPYTEADWEKNLELGEETGICVFTYSGTEQWQADQARTAYMMSSARQAKRDRSKNSGGIKLLLSLDMNVLPSSSRDDMLVIVNLVEELGRMPGQLKVTLSHATDRIWGRDGAQDKEKVVLSTFGGGEVDFDGAGWEGFLTECKLRDLNIYFMPSFFLPPEQILKMPYVDATFDWNSGWPMENYTISAKSDQVFIRDRRPYMAAVSPWFFTHYGTEGQWAWNKNWIYRSDDNLYASRWLQILDKKFDPEFVQVISWNDYGESHYIGPVMGAQPGSEKWTEHHGHDGWRHLTKYFIERYKRLPRSNPNEMQIWLTYRTHTKELIVPADTVGKPNNVDWAQDVISVAVLLPETTTMQSVTLEIKAGDDDKFSSTLRLIATDRLQTFVVPFGTGKVSFKIKEGPVTLLEGKGAEVTGGGSDLEIYNFNAWSGYWNIKAVSV